MARRQLARILGRLLTVPRQDLDRWAAETKGVERFLEEVYPDLPDFLTATPGDPLHRVRHYLADADIRATDAEYADAQEQAMRDLIRRIEMG